jgi:hypothetical protein
MEISTRSEFLVLFSIGVNFSGIFGPLISQWEQPKAVTSD